MANKKRDEVSESGERVVIFIDGSNFYHSLKDTFGFKDSEIDFRRL